MTREEAIEEIKDASDGEIRHGDYEHHPDLIERRVEAFFMAIQALSQERESGEWIPIPYELDCQSDAECSLCHGQFINAIRYDYCPYCGAYMKKSEGY